MAGKEMVFRIFDQVEPAAALTTREVLKHARKQFRSDCPWSTIHTAMTRLVEAGALTRQRHGVYRRSA